jgi:hypothetical protein
LNIHEQIRKPKIRTNMNMIFHVHIHIREYEYESNMVENLMFIFANMNIRASLAGLHLLRVHGVALQGPRGP